MARAQNNLGLVLIRQGYLQQAREHLDSSLRIFEETGVELGKSHVLLSLAELEIDDNDPDAARQRSEEARDLAERSNESGSLSKAHELLGRVAESRGDAAVADREFRTAISILERVALPEHLVGSLAAYATVLEGRGDTEGALEQLKRAVSVTRPDLAAQGGAAERANQETA